jgi:hypothetical protein
MGQLTTLMAIGLCCSAIALKASWQIRPACGTSISAIGRNARAIGNSSPSCGTRQIGIEIGSCSRRCYSLQGVNHRVAAGASPRPKLRGNASARPNKRHMVRIARCPLVAWCQGEWPLPTRPGNCASPANGSTPPSSATQPSRREWLFLLPQVPFAISAEIGSVSGKLSFVFLPLLEKVCRKLNLNVAKCCTTMRLGYSRISRREPIPTPSHREPN